MRKKARPCDPLTTRRDINRMRIYFKKRGRNGERDAMLITIGCNTGLRASDLCRLLIGQVNGDYIDIVEQKTKKRRVIPVNAKMKKEIAEYIEKTGLHEDEYVFYSERGGHIQPKHIHKIMKRAALKLGIRGNIGSHTLRKTMAYHTMRGSRDPKINEKIMRMFNHSSIEATKRYLQNSAEIDDLYMGLEL